jgi:hypothetical protein
VYTTILAARKGHRRGRGRFSTPGPARRVLVPAPWTETSVGYPSGAKRGMGWDGPRIDAPPI